MEDTNIMRPIDWSTRVVFVLFSFAIVSGALGTNSAYAVYDVPPGRRITWNAGLDPVGGIPNYMNVTCTGLEPTGVADNTSRIQTCINNAASGTAVFIPAGTYKISADLNMKSNIALRGAKATASGPFLPNADASMTTLNLTGGSRIVFPGGSKSANWNPGPISGTPITAGYTQGSTSLTLSDASSYAVNDWISVYQNTDSNDISVWESYLGEDASSGDPHVFQQYTRVTGKNGNVLTISPPLYLVTKSPTGQSVRKQTFGVAMAGVENMRLNGSGTQSYGIVSIVFSKNVWVKGVETYYSGNYYGGSPHVWIQFSLQCEVRDGYYHYGSGYDGGMNYGVQMMNWNSAHKVENNIVRETRHAIAFDGNSGSVVLYNYTDDNWLSVQGSITTIDNGYLGIDGLANHGAHPFMNLWEGNHVAHFGGDYVHGSSGYITLFRNRVACILTHHPLVNPWWQNCVAAGTYNRNYNIIGNVIGQSSWTSGTVLCDAGSCGPMPTIYMFGRTGEPGSYTDTLPGSTAIKHGNYDYITVGVAHWDGGADHALLNSMYYNSKPSFFGTCAWPPFGPEGNPTINTLPAKDRYDGTGICQPVKTAPAPPKNLRAN